MSGDTVYLQHILDAIEKIERYTAGLNEKEFARNDLVVDGVVRELEIIGEAARNISSALQQRRPEIPFAKIVGMRNQLTHEYFGVNLAIVWKTVIEDLPVLKQSVQKTLAG